MRRSVRIFKLCLWAFAGFMEIAWTGEIPCRRNRLIEQWLGSQAPRWRGQLAPLAGFEDPGGVEVCMAKSGNPRADSSSNRIWLPRLDYEEDRRSLVHEYLHLAFKHSSRTLDEAFIESTARQLLQGGL